MHEVLVNRLGGLSLPRKSVVRLTDRPDMTLDVYRGRKTAIQYNKTHVLESTECGSLVSGHYVCMYKQIWSLALCTSEKDEIVAFQ